MGASVFAYWPGITDEQREAQPGFRGDCKAWGDWMAEIQQDEGAAARLSEAGVRPIPHIHDVGHRGRGCRLGDPGQARLGGASMAPFAGGGAPPQRVGRLKFYEAGANGVDTVEEEFASDLEDVAELARWAKLAGATRMTLEVDW